MNHNPLNLQENETVLADGKQKVVIASFSYLELFAAIYAHDDPDQVVWTILTSRLTRI